MYWVPIMCLPWIVPFSFFLFLFPQLMEFLGQGSDQGHSCGNARSLIHGAGPGIKPASQSSQDAAKPIVPQQELPLFLSSPPMQFPSDSLSSLIHSIPYAPALSVTMDFFSVLEPHHFLPWVLLCLPRTISSLLLPPPSPAANIYSSSYRSESKWTSSKPALTTPPLFYAPHSTLYFSFIMECLCSLGKGPYLPSSSLFPQNPAVFSE